MASTTPQIVIIGAGIVGVNVADELVLRGWNNITVLEKGSLDSQKSSTSLSPGLVFQTSSSKTLSTFARYTVEKLLSLKGEGDDGSCFNQVGGLEVATTPERLEQLKRKKGWATSWGIEAKFITTGEVLDKYPLLHRSRVLGGLYTPTDGLASAARAVELLIARTRKAGVRYLANTLVTDIERTEDDRVTGVVTPNGTIHADIVVCCAGYWGTEVCAMVDLPLPLLPLAHQYVKTAPVLGSQDDSLPILRFQDEDVYYRTHEEQFGIGYYGHRPMPINVGSWVESARLDFTPDDFIPAWKASQNFLPILQKSKISKDAFNGVFSFTADGNPLIGQAPLVDNFYVVEAVWVAQSAGVARAMAEILTQGNSVSVDITDCELSRFNEVQLASSYIGHTGQTQSFMEVYDLKNPLKPRDSARNLRVSPFFARQQELGAVFNEYDAWEYPNWFEKNAELLKSMPEEWLPVGQDSPESSNYYTGIVAAEAWRTRTAVAMYDMTLLPRVECSGPGAADLLDRLTTCSISKKVNGTVTYTLLLNNQGGVRSDITVARLERNLFQVAVNTPIDVIYLQREARVHMQQHQSEWVQVRETTSGSCCVCLWGPSSRHVLEQVTTDNFSNTKAGLRSFRVKRAIVGGIPVTVMRVSYVGELGFEIYTTADNGLRLWDTLWEAGQPWGVIAAGRLALDALRLEKGFRATGFDFTTEHNPYQAGISFALKRKDGYIGQAALDGVSNETLSSCLRCLVVDDGKTVVQGKEPVYHHDQLVGYTTTAGFGYTVKKSIAYAHLISKIVEGDGVEIEFYGRYIRATVTSEPLFDPKMTRVRETADPATVKPDQEVPKHRDALFIPEAVMLKN